MSPLIKQDYCITHFCFHYQHYMERMEPCSPFFQETALDKLHAQSGDWLNEIAFWRDEITFLYLVTAKEALSELSLLQNSGNSILIGLKEVLNEILDQFEEDLKNHHGALVAELEKPGSDNTTCHDLHQVMAWKFHVINMRIRELKRDLFLLKD